MTASHKLKIVFAGHSNAVLAMNGLEFKDTNSMTWTLTKQGIANADNSQLCQSNPMDSMMLKETLKLSLNRK